MIRPTLTIKGKGEPLIWLHGMLNSVESDSAYSLIDFEELSKLALLIRYNYCDSSASGNYTWPALAEELIRVADSQNFHRAILGGLSMGSGTVLHAAVRFPERVKALILVTPPPAWETREDVKKVYRKIASKTNPDSIPEILKRIILRNQEPPEFYEQKHPGTRQNLQNFRLGFDPGYYTRLYQDGADSDMPSRDQISKITVPTFIVALTDDINHPLGMAQEINNLISNSELFVISNYDDYRKLQEKLSDFISAVLNNNKS